MGRDCIFEKHKRGRKPEKIKFKELEKSFQSIEKALEDLRKLQKEGSGGGNQDVGGLEDEEADLDLELEEDAGRKPKRPKKSTSRITTSSRLIQQEEIQSRIEDDLEHTRRMMSVDEGKDLGVHSSSNPLGLLAQAGENARESETTDRIIGTGSLGSQRGSNGRLSFNNESISSRNSIHSIGASSTSYFTTGIYSSKLDIGPRFDPIDLGILSISKAEQLFDFFMANLDSVITLLDPIGLHTFEYVKSHSSLLLTSISALSCRFMNEAGADQLTQRLDDHVKQTLLPAILLEGYR